MSSVKSACVLSCANSSCFGYLNGRCAVLTDNRFERDCPFFKTSEQKRQQEEMCKERIRQWKRGESIG